MLAVLLAGGLMFTRAGNRSTRQIKPDCKTENITESTVPERVLCYIHAASGGTVELPSGSKIEIPPQSLYHDTYIFLGREEEIHGGVYVHKIEPTGLLLKKPARVTLPIIREALLPGEVIDDGTMAVYFDGMESPIPVTVDMEHGFIRYEISKF